MKENLIKKLAVTFELCGGVTLSEGALNQIIDDLSQYSETALSKSLDRCRAEVRVRLTPADIIQRIDDGRPGPEEAWALLPKNEDVSVCWTREMAVAYGVCCSLIGSDMVAARMAFLEAYRKEVQISKSGGIPIKWEVSFGFVKSERHDCLRNAVLEGKIERGSALAMCPEMDMPPLLGEGNNDLPLLIGDLVDKLSL